MNRSCLVTAVLFLLLAQGVRAQEASSELYLVFEFMRVDGEQSSAYMETEEFWAGIHQQRVKSGEIIGWDLWSLLPGGEDQRYQYLTVTLFDNMTDMMKGTTGSALLAHARNAYPGMSEEELTAKFNDTPKTRDLAVRVFLEQVDGTQDDFSMELGTITTIDLMKALDSNYEKMESEIFKPSHQAMVDNGAKGSWGLLRVLVPYGSDTYASHITVNMYKDWEQMLGGPASGGGESELAQDLAVEEGLKTRDMKWVYLATLVNKVR